MKWERFSAISLNPALDVTLWVAGLDREYNDVLAEQCEAAGKAVNVARVLRAFGTDCRALILAGEQNREQYFERLDEDGVGYETVTLPGLIRENISVVLPDGTLLRLARPGFLVPPEKFCEMKERFASFVSPGTLVVAAGKNPRGVSPEDFIDLCAYIKGLGGTLAVDTSSLCEREICEIAPWVIKPNLGELEQMTGETLDSTAKIAGALRRFHDSGVEHAVVSMGGDGVLYSSRDGLLLQARVPQVSVRSTVGAGDSTLSGFLLACQIGRPIEECVRVAASFGTAAVMRDGTNPPLQSDLAWVYPRVVLSRQALD